MVRYFAAALSTAAAWPTVRNRTDGPPVPGAAGQAMPHCGARDRGPRCAGWPAPARCALRSSVLLRANVIIRPGGWGGRDAVTKSGGDLSSRTSRTRQPRPALPARSSAADRHQASGAAGKSLCHLVPSRRGKEPSCDGEPTSARAPGAGIRRGAEQLTAGLGQWRVGHHSQPFLGGAVEVTTVEVRWWRSAQNCRSRRSRSAPSPM